MGHRTFVCILAFSTLVRVSAADEHAPTPSEVLFKQGRQPMEQGAFAKACAMFRESERLEPAAGTRLNLANCEEKNGRPATALALWKDAVLLLSTDDERAPAARKRIADLEERVPRLTLRLAPGAPPSAHVALDDRDVTASLGTRMPVDPGDHVVVVAAENYAPSRSVVSSSTGKEVEASVAPGALAAERRPPPSTAERALVERSSAHWLPPFVVGTGVALGAAGAIVLGFTARDYNQLSRTCKPDCAQSDADSIATRQTASLILLGAGAVAIVAGVVWWVGQGSRTAPRRVSDALR